MSVFWLNVKLPGSCGAVKQREIGQQIQQIKHFLFLQHILESFCGSTEHVNESQSCDSLAPNANST